MAFDPTKEYHLRHVSEHEITYFEYQLSEAITLIADYLDEPREETMEVILERYDTKDVNFAILQMITYMYADVATKLENINKYLYK